MTPPAADPPPGSGRAAAVAAVVVLIIISFLTSAFGMLVLVFASDPCGDQDTHFVCTVTGQNLIPVVPFYAGAAGVLVALVSCGRKPGVRGKGIRLGYVISIGGFLLAWIVASAPGWSG
ncbi:hypothetical protein [Actinoplanes sp. NPDC020271]|uniref:hypothetical protein n=1 Tax=Actinoplanes sp. NPDC020271 TaxID=3363896 RepID=UPI0037AC55B9